MPSPSRPPRDSPPQRAALNQRSESHINEGAVSSLRMVGQPQANTYGTTPYPTKPSQILSPIRTSYPASPWAAALSSNPPDSALYAISSSHRALPDPETSSTDVSSLTASANDLPMTTSSILPAGTRFPALSQDFADVERISDDIVELPSVPARGDHISPLSASNPSTFAQRQPAAKISDTSLSSTNSTGTMIVKKNRDTRRRGSYSAFPYVGRSSSSRSNMSISPAPRTLPRGTDDVPGPSSPTSPSSPAFSTSTDRRYSSAPEYMTVAGARRGDPDLQFPTIKPASVSGSWAESSSIAPLPPPRALERNQERWNPHLSTVPSEGTGSGSYSGGRVSQSLWSPDSSRASQTSSGNYTSRVPSDPSRIRGAGPELPIIPGKGSSASPPLSQPAPPPRARPRDFTGSTIRIVSDEEEAPPAKLETVPGSRDEETPREKRASWIFGRPGSRASFFKDSIPTWAKAYYGGRPKSSIITKTDSDRRISISTGRISLNIPPHRSGVRRKSDLGFYSSRPGELDLAGARRASVRRKTQDWSPHLWHDRASLGKRRSIFVAPSINEEVEEKTMTKRNVQILLFAFGFVLPPSWWVASFLPLPPKPDIVSEKHSKRASRQLRYSEDLEWQKSTIDETRYENARWWRNVNRIMSAFGLIIAAVFIALAVVSS